MKHLSQSDALTKSNSTEEKMNRIPLILTYHPLNTGVQQVLLDNFKVIADDPATSLIFPRPAMVAFRCDDNLQTSLVRTAEKQAATCAGTYPLLYLWPHFQRNRSSGAKGPHNHYRLLHLFVLWSGLLHLVPSLPSQTERTLRERFGEHLRSINKNAPGFPVAEHFRCNGHILQTTHWSVGSNSVMGKNRGRGRKCDSSFDSGHASHTASMLIFTSFEVRTHACKM